MLKQSDICNYSLTKYLSSKGNADNNPADGQLTAKFCSKINSGNGNEAVIE